MKANVKKMINRVVMESAKKGANSASAWRYYQPVEPKGLSKLKK